ncbi:MAG TPA: hypothetical protein VGL81_24580 [Polyangiaceae bacterium]
MNHGSSPVTQQQAAQLDSSANGTAAPNDVGSAILPCKAWTLEVVVKSTVPFYPEGTVTVGASITAGGDGYTSKGTQMDGPESPPTPFKGGGTLTYSLSASASKWDSAGATSVSVSPRVEPFKATVLIKPRKPWAIVKMVDSRDDALIPKLAVGLKLGEYTKAGTTAQDKPAVFQDLETATKDGMALGISNARNFDVSSVEHPDVVWEFVSISSA